MIITALTTITYALPEERAKKAIGIFNIVQFPNDVCNSNTATMNGTGYTAEECSSRDGVASGTCADGYGVCCIITLACGSRTSENCTYLDLASTSTPKLDSSPTGTRACSYTICPRDSTINRIRLDMQMFQIAGPTAIPTAENTGTPTAAAATSIPSVGQCNSDSFSVTGTGGPYPVICGMNNGQHMIVDTDGTKCVTATFSFGQSATRAYSIHVLQFASSNKMGGPSGCLQYFTGATGIVKTFNWQTVASSTHLQNQNYDVCVRRTADFCVICWSPTTAGKGTATVAKGSFGLSNGGSTDAATAAAAGSLSGSGTNGCNSGTSGGDYVIIPGGVGATAAPATGVAPNSATVATKANGDRFCGRYFNAAVAGSSTDASVCSSTRPFKMTVVTDGSERAATAAAVATQTGNEGGIGDAAFSATENLGTMGFSLTFNQIAC